MEARGWGFEGAVLSTSISDWEWIMLLRGEISPEMLSPKGLIPIFHPDMAVCGDFRPWYKNDVHGILTAT
jgi:hypothetical protein